MATVAVQSASAFVLSENLVVVNTENGTAEGVISNLSVSRSTFDPEINQYVNFSFDLSSPYYIHAYVKNVSTNEVDYIFADKVFTLSGSDSYRWYGRANNSSSGHIAADGVYQIIVTAFARDIIVDQDAITVTVDSSTNVQNPPVISNLNTIPNPFNPGNGQVTNITFSTNTAADLSAVVSKNGVDYASYFTSNVNETAGVKTVTWNGIYNNNVVADGIYTVSVYAQNADGSDAESTTVEVTSTPVTVTEPVITNMTVSPSTFDPNNSYSTISYTVDRTSNQYVQIKNGASVIRTFSAYDGDSYSAGTKTLIWDGKNTSGSLVSEGTYTVYVKASNSQGYDEDTRSVTVDYVSGGTCSGLVSTFDVNPSGTWDPNEDDEMEIDFEIEEDVDSLRILAKKGSESVELYDEDDLDEGEYDLTWDGTDEDSDQVSQGQWQIQLITDNCTISEYVTIEYDKPEITSAFVTKTSFDPTIDEVTNLVFKVDSESVVTVEVYDGSKREVTLLDEETVRKNRWYSVEWDGMDDDGDPVDEGSDWQFKITAENESDDDIFDTESVGVTIKDDEVSGSKSNATNDMTDPVVFDNNDDTSVTVKYCIDEDAEVYLAIYKGTSASGKAEVELLDYVDQKDGCHNVKWNVTDDDGKDLKDNTYSYKLITRVDNYKDTEIGSFVVGDAGDAVSDDEDDDDDNDDNDYEESDCDVDYYDVDGVGNEMCEAITWATENDIFEGYNDGSFKPSKKISRAETLKVIFEAFSDEVTLLPENGSNLGFKDVDTDAWYMTYARTAKFYGMLHGYVNSTEARLGNTVTRVEMLKFALEASDAFTSFEVPGYEVTYYSDVKSNNGKHDWFWDYAGASYVYGLFNGTYDENTGKRYLLVDDQVTRGEAALLLYRMHLAGLLD